MAAVWKLPPRIKVYEALGALADGRLTIISPTEAKVVSSSGGKSYDVIYNLDANEINTNDNGSYWQGYLGYPALAFLMHQGILPFDPAIAETLKGIEWKQMNQQFKNNWPKVEAYLYERAPQAKLEQFAADLLMKLESLQLQRPATRMKPPKGW